jgi:hypothetical protein
MGGSTTFFYQHSHYYRDIYQPMKPGAFP